MNIAYLNSPDLSFFDDTKVQLDTLIADLQSDLFSHKEHGEIERHIRTQGNELLRRLLQGYLDYTADKEERTWVVERETNKPPC